MTLPARVLDSAQLTRIESLHKGFLYQHLYGVACLLRATAMGATAVIVEHDDDLEISLPKRHAYIQVKTRGHALRESDLTKSLAVFDKLRTAHSDGSRVGTPSFLVVSNVPPGDALAAKMKRTDWPGDVSMLSPGALHDELPPAWPDIRDALAWCFEAAGALPFTVLSPEALVWKLTGHVLLAASASAEHADHTILVERLPQLFEQLIQQMQDFPLPPPTYRAQAGEPPLVLAQRVRVITGFSGAGKTAWVSNAVLHVPGQAVYFDVADVPGSTLAASLAREIGARLVATGKVQMGELLKPGASGMDMLRLLDRHFSNQERGAIVVIDNAHRAVCDDLLAVLNGTTHLQFVLLGYPSPELDAVRRRLALTPEELPGWGNETVAAEASSLGARADYPTCERLIELTGGLPLYVQSALQLAVSAYGGDVATLCGELAALTHLQATAQETILYRTFRALPEGEQLLVAALSVAACPVSIDEATLIARELVALKRADLAAMVRRLCASGALRVFGNQRLKVHDAVRLVGRARLGEQDPAKVAKTHLAFKEVLLRSLKEHKDVTRFALLVHELGVVGDIDTLTDIASDEMFHEIGLQSDFVAVLDRASRQQSLRPNLRYWALDGIAFSQLQRGELEGLRERLDLMTRLVKEGELGSREVLALGMKVMLFAAAEGRREDVQHEVRHLLSALPREPSDRRLVKYNAALALHQVGAHGPARSMASGLVTEYYEALGIEPRVIVGRNPDSIWPLLPRTNDVPDNLKRLADTLDLYARSSNAAGEDSRLARFHAVKFYSMAGAYRSSLKVGQDLADEVLGRGDRVGARQVCEQILLPTLQATKMLEWVVPIRSQYAVVLAYCGDFAAAAAEMNVLLTYEPGLSEHARGELGTQRKLIEDLRAAKRDLNGLPPLILDQAIGGQIRCPCGSGLMFSKCHGSG